MIVDFIREYKDHQDDGGLLWGVEPICSVLTEHGCQIAPSTYYEHVGRGPTDREWRDAHLTCEIYRVHRENYGVYGARKVWLQLNREHIPVARCTVERLMRDEGLTGAVRGKIKRTTIADPAGQCARDLVRRRFAPLTPDRLWVGRFHIRLDLVGVGVRGVRDRRLRPQDPRLGGLDEYEHRFRAPCSRAGRVDPQPVRHSRFHRASTAPR